MRFFIFLLVALFLLSCNSNTLEENTPLDSKALLIPAYFYDKAKWKELNKLTSNATIIINPNSGPGESVDSNYKDFIDTLLAKEKKPIGYIYTKWSKRDIEEVEADIDTWLELYPNIQGFFIDEVANSKEEFNYYQTLSNYIKAKRELFIVLNPGTFIDENYYSIANTIVVFENSVKELNSTKDYCQNFNSQSALIVYEANKTQMQDIIAFNSCKYFYITDDSLANPYDTLPSFLDEEDNTTSQF